TDGVGHAHNASLGAAARGAFVSQWTINKTTLAVNQGSDAMQHVFDGGTGAAITGTALNFSRFCSADLPAASALFNPATGNGTTARIYMNGEEVTGGRAMAHVITGPNAGNSYTLPLMGGYAWENLLANPATGDTTLVMGDDDGPTRPTTTGRDVLTVYVGT